MALVIAEFGSHVVGPGGNSFRARACALPTRRGLWEGWLEFDPIDGAPTFRSDKQTIQTDRSAVVSWATMLTPSHLEYALGGALKRIGRA